MRNSEKKDLLQGRSGSQTMGGDQHGDTVFKWYTVGSAVALVHANQFILSISSPRILMAECWCNDSRANGVGELVVFYTKPWQLVCSAAD